MKNLSASAVTKERSISRGHGGLKIVCIFIWKIFRGGRNMECLINGVCEINQLISKTK